ncbi:Serine/threonine-protein kinase par-1 [Boothiomyces sp. JEL0866]|nr:Serine/threonine-protein kinase par-1 [Boothiomyces sp. JEL0866]
MKLANYKIGNTIGEGAFSKVKLGQHLPSGEKVAIKILNKKFMKANKENGEKMRKDRERIRVLQERKRIYHEAIEAIKNNQIEDQENLDQFIQKVKQDAEKLVVERKEEPQDYLSDFQKEVLLLMRLNHPNIIKTYKVIDGTEDIYIIMEYCAGGELADLVKKQKMLSEHHARKLFRQLVSAIQFTHESGVVHRDLKLENILLNEEGNILVSDFGLGTFASNDKLETICGTPYYSAPELMNGIKYDGKKVDIWAMGVILYYMVAGHPPFMADSLAQLESVVRKLKYRLPTEFSIELCILLKAIFVKENERIDMEGIRNDGWVNYECVSKPVRLEPVSIDRNGLAAVISSVTFDSDCTVYHIRQHNQIQLLKDKEQYEKTQRRNSSHDIASLKRRKSINIQVTQDSSVQHLDSSDSDTSKNMIHSSNSSSFHISNEHKSSIIRSTSSGSKNIRLPSSELHDRKSPNMSSLGISEVELRNTNQTSSDIKRHSFTKNEHDVGYQSHSRKSSTEGLDHKRKSSNKIRPTLLESEAFSNVLSRPIIESPPIVIEAMQSPLEQSLKVKDSIFARMRKLSLQKDTRNRTIHNLEKANINSQQVENSFKDVRLRRAASVVDRNEMLKETSIGMSSRNSFTEAIPHKRQSREASIADRMSSILPKEDVKLDIEDITNWHEIHKPATKIRTVKFSLNGSVLPPAAMFQELHKTLVRLKQQYPSMTFQRLPDYYVFKVQVDELELKVEIVKVWLVNMHALKFKKICGSSKSYFSFCDTLVLNLEWN